MAKKSTEPKHSFEDQIRKSLRNIAKDLKMPAKNISLFVEEVTESINKSKHSKPRVKKNG